jgi:hypothetical protein
MAQDTGIKTFVSSAQAVSDDSRVLKTIIDDIEVSFVTPDLDQMVLITTLIENATSTIHAGAALVNIFFGLIKPDDTPIGLDGEEVEPDDVDDDSVVFFDYTARRLQAKMMDRHDPFGLIVIADVMRWLLEEWSARPTTPSSRSSSTPARRGSTSKATPRGATSTRGRSRR